MVKMLSGIQLDFLKISELMIEQLDHSIYNFNNLFNNFRLIITQSCLAVDD